MQERLEGLGGVGAAALASVTPGMVSRVAELAERSATALDLLTHPDVLTLLGQLQQSAPALTHALKRVEQLQQSGALDTLLDLAEGAPALMQSAADAREEAARSTGTVGLFGLMTVMKEAEVQSALRFMLAMARRLPAGGPSK